ncbi:MAG: hypothetical protein Q8S03_04180 [Brevundimonas sp.]|uniref:hypothetical protein n=1 Tax=Brevundimonas sp. TaxID=1871086 RepID=UPI002734D693|nr:hypothetical protein [Brevundimonas sp.]MDP3403866.1 hypothetical protein [Brevundimonas sp.]
MNVLKIAAGTGLIVALALALLVTGKAYALPQGLALTPSAPTAMGKAAFVLPAYTNASPKTLRVWTYRPAAWTPGDPVVFVMHGMGRNAEEYLDTWVEAAEQRQFLLVAPEFDNPLSRYVTRDYQEGNVRAVDGTLTPEEEWAFTVIENIFDRLQADNGWTIPAYDIFGHSAGSQFVQRMVMLKPDARIRRAVAANAGTYTFPDPQSAYPFGLGGVPHDLPAAYGVDLTLLLGELDNSASQGRLDQSPPAMAQGPHRLGRGQALFRAAQVDAESRNVTLRWKLQTVPGVGHDFEAMSAAAAGLF